MAFIGIYSRNKQEMRDLKCILVVWYTFNQRKKKYQCIPSFPLKTIRRYFIKLNYNFQIFNQFCCFVLNAEIYDR
jgi:hypothetical protein